MIENIVNKLIPKKDPIMLVVDDDPTVHLLYSAIGKKIGYEVQTADDGSTALGLLRTNSYDLILTDMQMKKVHGDELAKEIKTNPEYSHLDKAILHCFGTHETGDRSYFNGRTRNKDQIRDDPNGPAGFLREYKAEIYRRTTRGKLRHAYDRFKSFKSRLGKTTQPF